MKRTIFFIAIFSLTLVSGSALQAQDASTESEAQAFWHDMDSEQELDQRQAVSNRKSCKSSYHHHKKKCERKYKHKTKKLHKCLDKADRKYHHCLDKCEHKYKRKLHKCDKKKTDTKIQHCQRKAKRWYDHCTGTGFSAAPEFLTN